MLKIFNPKLFTIIKKKEITKQILLNDIVAGIIVGVVALPLSIAFAVASGVSPEKGIITAIIAGFIVSLLGGSRVQIAGPTGAFIVILYGIVTKYGIHGLMISTIMAGIILIFFGLFKLGNLLKYFPNPLIVGFTSGIAVVIFSTQIKDALGLEIDKLPSDFFAKWLSYIDNINSINLSALAITIVTILLVVYTKKITSKIPGSFIAIILCTIVVNAFGIDVTNIQSFFGNISNNISFTLPHFSIFDIKTYIVPALIIAILGSVESLLSAVVSDGMIGGSHRSNTELIAQGIANIVSPIFGGVPATGAIARTATNINNGGRTPVAGIVHSFILLLIMMLFMNYAKLIPMSCLAGILIVVSYNMSEWKSFISNLKGSPYDYIIMLVTFFITIIVDLTLAIEIGIMISALFFMKRMADIDGCKLTHDSSNKNIKGYDELPDGISVYEIGGPLFFASAKQYAQIITNFEPNTSVIIIRMEFVSYVDNTGIHNLKEAIKLLQKSNMKVLISGIKHEIIKDLYKGDVISIVGRENIHKGFKRATQHAKLIVEA